MAERNEVWLLTVSRNRQYIEPRLDKYPGLRERIHPVYVELPQWTGRWRSNPHRKNPLHYILWQSVARRAGERLHREIGFDVAHNITWTVNWLPAGVSRIRGLPCVWGPVSGVTGTPRALWRWLGWRGLLGETARGGFLPISRFLLGSGSLRRARLVVANNREVAQWARGKTTTIVEPVVAIRIGELKSDVVASEGSSAARTAVFAARFVPWKGLRLAVAALARPEAAGWSLDVYGRGSEERAARRLARRMGVAGRVRFLGSIPRPELHAAIARADAFVSPSFHDAPPFVVGEALSLGCPVVCLDWGGPAALVADGQGVRVPPRGDVVGGLAAALASVPPHFTPDNRWATSRIPDLLDSWYRETASRRPNKGNRRIDKDGS